MRRILLALVLAGIGLVGTILFWRAISSQGRSPTQQVSSSRIEESGTALPPSTWKTYTNSKFGFSFQYPSNFSADSDDELFTGQDDRGTDIVVGPAFTPEGKLPEEFDVFVHDPRQPGTDEYGDASSFWAQPLKDLIPKIWDLIEKDNAEISSPPTETTIAGEDAFQFTIKGAIGWNGAGRSIDEENLWIFLETGDVKLELALPNDQMFRGILQTLRFTHT